LIFEIRIVLAIEAVQVSTKFMRQITITILLIIGLQLFGQEKPSEQVKNKKYIAWFSPSKTTELYGLMFNFSPRFPDYNSTDKYPVIYGSEINLNPIGLFTPFVLAIYSIDPATHCPVAKSLDSIKFDRFKIIQGIQVGLINMEPTIINGLDINISGSFESKTNGLTISLVMNKHYISNGLTIALIGNQDTKCNGVQIGLINSAVNLKGVQIGLWNKNQKRNFPIINWNFK
jgi:hypothetical protein